MIAERQGLGVAWAARELRITSKRTGSSMATPIRHHGLRPNDIDPLPTAKRRCPPEVVLRNGAALPLRPLRRGSCQRRRVCSLLIVGDGVCRRKCRPRVDSPSPEECHCGAPPRAVVHDDRTACSLGAAPSRADAGAAVSLLRLVQDRDELTAASGPTVRALDFVTFVEEARAANAALEALLLPLEDFDAAIARKEVRLPMPECRAIADKVERLVPHLDRVEVLAASIGISSEIRINLAELQDEAAVELAAGPAAPERAQLLAKCLPVRTGFRALTRAIATTTAPHRWDATLGFLLEAFRGSDAQFISRLTRLAKLSSAAIWSEQESEQLDLLAAVLADHAKRNRCR